MGIIENILKNVVLQDAIIEKKVKISESVYKIRISSDSIKTTAFIPGYFLRLFVGIGNEEISFKDKVRSYSVWNINQEIGYLDMAIAINSGGTGAKWVTECEEGNKIYFKWKKGNFLIDNSADSYLMIGDVSALSHLYILKRSLPSNKQISGLIHSKSSEDFFDDIDGSEPFNYHLSQNDSILEIIDKVKEITPKMKGEKMVYIAGDSRVCVALHKYFRNELNWNTKQIKTKPFWNPQKKGLE